MNKTLQHVTILFAGDSGDGIQLTGSQFTDTLARFGNDLGTFPDFPSEIRSPQGTLGGVSGFQVKYGSGRVYTSGDKCDVLIAMNAASLKVNLPRLKKGGLIVANSDGFEIKYLRLAGYADDRNPLTDGSLESYKLVQIPVTHLTREALDDMSIGMKNTDRSKNMFVLGYVCWLFDRPVDTSIEDLKEKFAKKTDILEANLRTLEAGYRYGVESGEEDIRIRIGKADLPKGQYRNITGNHAAALGLIAGAKKSGLNLFYGGYPITPATDILHFLAKYKYFGVKTFQCEDEIAGVCSAIGASYGGALATTATSGPGMALKTEALGLAVMTELPLVVINVQRGGPSTGLPTKTEQSDLYQAIYGRNGEAPIPILAAKSSSDCFNKTFEACKIAVEHMTPVIVLSDGYIANGSEPWRFPQQKDLPQISPRFATKSDRQDGHYMPYKRDENFVRPWAAPGLKDFTHRLGGLEKLDGAGTMSSEAENHQKMVFLRQAKIDRIADFLPEQTITAGASRGKVLVVGWGSTYGIIRTTVENLIEEGYEVAHAHVEYILPFPKKLGEILHGFDKVLVPEMNNGQLVHILRDRFMVDAIPFSKVKGIPFNEQELEQKILEIY